MNDFLSIKGTDCWLPLAPMFHAQAWLIQYHALCIGYKVVNIFGHTGYYAATYGYRYATRMEYKI